MLKSCRRHHLTVGFNRRIEKNHARIRKNFAIEENLTTLAFVDNASQNSNTTKFAHIRHSSMSFKAFTCHLNPYSSFIKIQKMKNLIYNSAFISSK
jgi:hypothetical protein